uniref:Uncharacterized protein n=1 Tax=Gopherus agassizii TaxID=38772 RepID=A0A452IF66_9SAUR
MDVSDSPEQHPCSPEEEDQQLSDDEILKESGSDRELDGEGHGNILEEEEEEDAARGLSQGEEENHSDEEDHLSETKSQDSDNNEQSRELKSSLCHKEEEEDRTIDLGDEASSVTRELDEHELDYDEEVPEDPSRSYPLLHPNSQPQPRAPSSTKLPPRPHTLSRTPTICPRSEPPSAPKLPPRLPPLI